MKCAKSLTPSGARRLRSTGGAALVIMLMAVAVITGLVVFFFLSVSLQRQLSQSSAGQASADVLGRTAIDTIVGDLRSEIVAGSAAPLTAGTNSIYMPLNRSFAVPYRVADQGYTNVLKKSSSLAAFWDGSGAPVRSAQGNSTETPSADGRYIDKDRWNKPYLLSSATNLPTTFVAPDWVIITRQGAVTNAPALPPMDILANDATGNVGYAIGRYAYVIYDEGGLVDVNVAGRPGGLDAGFRSKRGLLPQIDLNAIPGVTDGEAFVKWRNASSSTVVSAYENYVFNNPDGFTKVKSGDQKFINRQDLLNYVKNHPNQISTDALPFLGTFSREINSPTYSPRLIKPPGVIDDTYNPNLAIQLGADQEPLKRFPLTRLRLIKSTATATTAPTDAIYKYFGLTRATANVTWRYNHSSPNKILTLAEVKAAGRDPDFFELLQAAIAQGSLGKTGGNPWADVNAQDQFTAGQIIQIGLNLIDQYNEGSFPTRVLFNNVNYSGLKNLPYLSRVCRFVYRPQPGEGGWDPEGEGAKGFTRPWIGTWLMPEVWNPFANPAGVVSGGPTQLRFAVTGKIYTYVVGSGNNNATKDFPTNISSDSGLKFEPRSFFQQPTVLSGLPSVGATTGTTTETKNDFIGGANSLIGVFVASLKAPDKEIGDGADSVNDTNFTPNPGLKTAPLNYLLQYWNPDSNSWVTYDQMRAVAGVTAHGPGTNNDYLRSPGAYLWDSRVDPTSDRFGVLMQRTDPLDTAFVTKQSTIRPTWEPGVALGEVSSFLGTGWNPGADTVGLLSDNTSSSGTRYADPDGVQRSADGAYAQIGNLSGYPLADNNLASRPVMLNRDFRSVAEMGYASRGMPWKHLDFFTENSADAALLDLFSVYDDPALIAGRINPNTRSQEVLAAVISGGSYTDIDTTTISQTDAAQLAKQIVETTTSPSKGPLLNKSELATVIAPNVTTGDPTNDRVKARREAVVRSLADVSNTRTWNLLIDVIVQAGHYPKNAADLNQFRVNGTKRYWVHVAIDRYTNKVVDQVWEPVLE